MVKPVVIIAALAAEIAPLRRSLRARRSANVGDCTTWIAEVAGTEVVMLICGMGSANATAAATAVLALQPAVICSIGFGGAVRPGLEVGDLVQGEHIFTWDCSDTQPVPVPAMRPACPPSAGLRCATGSFLTVTGVADKLTVASLLPSDLPHPVLEMETAAIARVASNADIPCLVLRAISDTAEENLGFSLDEFCDHQLKLHPWRIMRTLARKPQLIPQLIRLAHNCRLAAHSLAKGVYALLPDLIHGDCRPENGGNLAGAPPARPD